MSKDFYCDAVLSRRVPVNVAAETARVLAFERTNPSWETHIVVIPKAHIGRLTDVEDAALFSEIFQIMAQIVRGRGFADSNFKIITNGGSYQSVQHLHIHLVSGAPLDPSNPAQKSEMAV